MIDILNVNRFKNDSPHGLILGEPGSGINFVTKSQISESLKQENTQIFIIDRYGDYNKFCNKNNGKIINLKPSNDFNYIIKYDEDKFIVDKNFIESKIYDFWITLCSLLKGAALTNQEKTFLYKCLSKYNPETLTELNEILEKEQSNKEELNLALMTEILKTPLFNCFNISEDEIANNKLINIDFSFLNKNQIEIVYLQVLFYIYNLNKNNIDKKIILYIMNPNIITSNKALYSFFYSISGTFRMNAGAITLVGTLDDILEENKIIRFSYNTSHICLLTQNSKNKEIIQSYFPSTEPFLDLIIDKSLKSGIILDGKTTHFFIIDKK